MAHNLIADPVSGLEALVGTWELAAGMGERTLGRAQVRFEWIEDGAFLVHRGEAEPALSTTPPEWLAHSPFPFTAVIGFDDAAGTFFHLYSDARGVRRAYRMMLSDDTWTMWGKTENGYHQRFVGHFSNESRTINGAWESSTDGDAWHRDFEETYTKIS